jgi:uncharacterized protein (DUF885 family)
MKKKVFPVLLTLTISIFFNPSFATGDKTAPADIEQLFDSYTRELIDLYPQYATRLALSKKMGYAVRKDKLNDESPEAIERSLAISRKYHRWLKNYDRTKLTPQQQRAADILAYALDEELEGEPFKYHYYVVNHMLGFHNSLTALMTGYHTIESGKDAASFLSRLRGYKQKIAQLVRRMKLQEEKGIIPPTIIIDRMMQSMYRFINVPPGGNILYTSFKERLKKIDMEETVKDEFCKDVAQAIREIVYPAYKSFIANLQRIRGKAGSGDGVWKLPDGDAFYRYRLKAHTGTDMTPAQVHKLGLKEVNRIQKEMKRLMHSAGFNAPGTASFSQFTGAFWRWESGRESTYYPNTAKGKKQALKDFQGMIDTFSDKTPQLFSSQPRTPVFVRPVPAFQQNTMGTNYLPASLDGKRKGTFYINLSYPPFKPGMETLTVHEAIPGHHFQIALQRESQQIRMFRNFVYFTAFVEGWALYAEKLAREHGWFKSYHSRIGSLNSELLRAVRLVLDTGIHYKRWSRERAFIYMKNNLGWASYGEIDRYLAWPGQACAYKMGELKILELRKRAKKALKKKFDIKEFHRVILENGSVPLKLLERFVDEYVEKASS